MNPSSTYYTTNARQESQCDFKQSPLKVELENIFSTIPYRKLLKSIEAEKVRAFSPLGRCGYHLESLIRAKLASYYLNLRSNAAIVRRLQEDPILAITCGFNPRNIPNRSTFSRFDKKLKENQYLVDECVSMLSTKLHISLPDFGKEVAVDSTPVRTYSNRKKEPFSDPEAGWIVKASTSIKKDWHLGYKLHLVVDANYELPIYRKLTYAKVSDMTDIIPLLTNAKQNLSWFKPEVVMADKGYDAGANYNFIVKELGAIPIIAMKARSKRPVREITGSPDNPCCMINMPLIYRGSDRKKGKKYVCPMRTYKKCTCEYQEQCGIKTIWIKDEFDYRRFGFGIKRSDDRWHELYHKRTAIERVNSRLKQTRRLEAHCLRGFENINLHSTLSVIVMQALALTKVEKSPSVNVRECVRKVG